MQNTILVSVLVGALAGIGGAFVAQGLVSSDAPRSVDHSSGLVPEGSEDTDALINQVASLQQKNEDLTMRLSSLEHRLNGSLREEIPTESSEKIAELQNQVVQLAKALDNPTSPESVSLRNAVSFALEDIRAAEEAERDAEREAREIRRMDERMEKYAKDLGLDQIQVKEMRLVLDGESIKREEMFNTMRDGTMDRGEMRTVMNDLREETRTALQGILTPAQYESYTESDRGFGRGMRGFDSGGNRGGGGRGGR